MAAGAAGVAGAVATAASRRLAGSIMNTTNAPRKQTAAPPQSSADIIVPAPASLPDIIRTRLIATSATPPMVSASRTVPAGEDRAAAPLLLSLMGGGRRD